MPQLLVYRKILLLLLPPYECLSDFLTPKLFGNLAWNIVSFFYCLCGERSLTATKLCFIFNICYLQEAQSTKIVQLSVSSITRNLSPRSLISLPFMFWSGCVHAFSATDTLCHRLLHRWNARPAVPGNFGYQATGHCGGAGEIVSIWCHSLWKDASNSNFGALCKEHGSNLFSQLISSHRPHEVPQGWTDHNVYNIGLKRM